MLLTEKEARAICEKLLSYVKADDASVGVTSENYGHLRFAANAFTTSGARENVSVGVTVGLIKSAAPLRQTRSTTSHLKRPSRWPNNSRASLPSIANTCRPLANKRTSPSMDTPKPLQTSPSRLAPRPLTTSSQPAKKRKWLARAFIRRAAPPVPRRRRTATSLRAIESGESIGHSPHARWHQLGLLSAQPL